jgi:hypothetical protein
MNPYPIQKSGTGPYPEPYESNTHPSTLKTYFNIIS